jgi:hypothetical protein
MSRTLALTVEPGPGLTPLAVVQHAINVRKRKRTEFDEVWCVLDVEGADKAPPLAQARKLAREEGIQLCLSNPCFEVWLLMHFRRSPRAYYSAREVVDELNRYWSELFGVDYSKSDPRVFSKLLEKLPDAIENSRWVRDTAHAGADIALTNSSSEIHILISLLCDP